MITLRPETAGDHEAVRKIHAAAFEGPAEATIVAQVRQNCREILSIVAVEGDAVLGHILFSPARLETRHALLHGMGLVPMAVLPEPLCLVLEMLNFFPESRTLTHRMLFRFPILSYLPGRNFVLRRRPASNFSSFFFPNT